MKTISFEAVPCTTVVKTQPPSSSQSLIIPQFSTCIHLFKSDTRFTTPTLLLLLPLTPPSLAHALLCHCRLCWMAFSICSLLFHILHSFSTYTQVFTYLLQYVCMSVCLYAGFNLKCSLCLQFMRAHHFLLAIAHSYFWYWYVTLSFVPWPISFALPYIDKPWLWISIQVFPWQLLSADYDWTMNNEIRKRTSEDFKTLLWLKRSKSW